MTTIGYVAMMYTFGESMMKYERTLKLKLNWGRVRGVCIIKRKEKQCKCFCAALQLHAQTMWKIKNMVLVGVSLAILTGFWQHKINFLQNLMLTFRQICWLLVNKDIKLSSTARTHTLCMLSTVSRLCCTRREFSSLQFQCTAVTLGLAS